MSDEKEKATDVLQLKAKQNIMTKFKYGRQFNSRDVRNIYFHSTTRLR